MKKEKAANSWAFRASICGITGIVVSTVCTVLFGWMPGIFGTVLGLLSIVFGIIARKQTNKERGKSGVVMGLITLVFSVSLVIILLVYPARIGQMAEEKGFPLIAKHARALSNGIVGMLIEIDADEDDPSRFLNELDAMKRSKNNGSNY